MITYLVGHRGSGKTSLLRRIAVYLKETKIPGRVFDLDEEVSRTVGKSVPQIFSEYGEDKFRELECDTLLNLARTHEMSSERVFLAVGAGYSGELPVPQSYQPHSHCIWVRRSTDSLGRIFMGQDRPRLDPRTSPIREYLSRFNERQNRYRKWADSELWVPEGFEKPNASEQALIFDGIRDFHAVLTLAPDVFSATSRPETWIQRRLGWGLTLELRDDLLEPDRIRDLASRLPPERTLISLRKDPLKTQWATRLKAGTSWDWPAEWGRPPVGKPTYVSLHAREARESVLDTGRKLEKTATPDARLKLSIEIRDFDELLQGHRWAAEDPDRRIFLPRSTDGRWRWYRLLLKGRSRLNFVREGDGSAPDQPTLLEWLRMTPGAYDFAAVLGDPVGHSRTPEEQEEFFRSHRMPVLAVPVSESDWRDGALDSLRELGLKAAAVTSPLKELAATAPGTRSDLSERLKSVNTLVWLGGNLLWKGTNTDHPALEKVIQDEIPMKTQIAVWGAGGTLSTIQSILPFASFFSARTAAKRETSPPLQSPPDAVIWGVGRSREDQMTWPPEEWKPKVVIDMNYSEDSPGREYALKTGARYVSGLALFKAQAEFQRQFWEASLPKPTS